jgi:hypothetical protein
MEKEIEKSVYEVVRYPTEHALGIQSPIGELLTNEQAIVELLNKVDKLCKVLTDK